MPAKALTESAGASGRRKHTRTYADRKAARLAKQELEKAEEKEWWDRLERFGDRVVALLKSGPVAEALVGGAAGAAFVYPTAFSVGDTLQLRVGTRGVWPGPFVYWADWRVELKTFGAPQMLLPRIDVFRLGVIDIGDSFAPRFWTEVHIESDTNFADGGKALAIEAAKKKARTIMPVIGALAGAAALRLAPEVLKGLGVIVEGLVPG